MTGSGVPPSTAEVRALRVLRAATAIGGLAQSLAGATGALLAARVAGSDAVGGLPQAALVAGSAVAAVGSSAIAVGRGRRTALVAGVGTAAAGCAVVLVAAVVGSLTLVLGGSLLLGAGNTAVMLARYAAAEFAPGTSSARAMSSVLVATTGGAVLGPVLLAPAGRLGALLGLPALAGPYLLAGGAFALAALTAIVGLPARQQRLTSTAPGPGPVTGGRAGRLGPEGTAGLCVLGLANLVMVGVMTMAPVQLHHLGHGLVGIGVVVSLHIGAMFAPAPLSGRLTDRLGGRPAAALAGGLLAVASGLAAVGAEAPVVLGTAMLLLGGGWNLALVSGSVLLVSGVRAEHRPRREGRGEVGMGFAAAGGGLAAGPLVAGGGYPALALAGASTAVLLVPAALYPLRRR